MGLPPQTDEGAIKVSNLKDSPLVLSCSLLFSLVLSCSLLFSLVLSCSLLFSLVLSCSLFFSRLLSPSLFFSFIHRHRRRIRQKPTRHPLFPANFFFSRRDLTVL